MGYSPWGRKESGPTEPLSIHTFHGMDLLPFIHSSVDVHLLWLFLVWGDYEENCYKHLSAGLYIYILIWAVLGRS